MANTITIKSSSYQGRYLKLDCSQVENIANNTSTINWTLTVAGGSVNYYSTGPTTVTINGEQVYYKGRTSHKTESFPAAKGTRSGSIVVPHNADGTKSITVSLSTAIYNSTVKTVSSEWTLTALPRAAQITSAPNFTDEEKPTITYINYAGNYATSLQACITLDGTQADIAYRDIAITGTSYTFNFTDEEKRILRLATLNGSNKRTLYFKLKTVIGGNTYASMSEAKTLTIVNAEPVINPVAYDTNEKTIALTGNSSVIIKGYNNVYVSANATAKKGADIVSYKIGCNEQYITSNSGTLTNIETANILFRATDNRGLVAELTPNILTLVDYAPLTCSLGATIEITGETVATATLKITGAFYSGSFGAASNTLKLYYKVKANNGEYGNWIAIDATPTFTDGRYNLTYQVTELDYLNAYTFCIMAVDALNSAYSQTATVKALPVFDWGENDFNFNVPISINNVELDYITEQGNSSGWYYRKWNSGKAECWVTISKSTAISKAWGSMYVGNSTIERKNYPLVFAEKPVEIASLTSGSNAAWLFAESGGNGINGAYATAIYNICRPTSITESQTYYINIYVCGRYK